MSTLVFFSILLLAICVGCFALAHNAADEALRNDYMGRFLAALELFTAQQDRIEDLEQACREAGITIPHGYAEAQRGARIERGHKILFPEEHLGE